MNVRFTTADARLRTSRLASAGAATRTQVPALVLDWRKSLIATAARDAARRGFAPQVKAAVRTAESLKGAPLEGIEIGRVAQRVYAEHADELAAAEREHLAAFGKSPQETVKRVVDELRPRVAERRDPFTPVALGDPTARAKEVVLWESPDAMVLADLFAPTAKALVVPKQAAMFPVDAPPALMDELARVAAHVSDAMMQVADTSPAGIWVNPPQDLTVKQLHVHVLPDLPDWSSMLSLGKTERRAPATKDLLADPVAAPRVRAFFSHVTDALATSLH